MCLQCKHLHTHMHTHVHTQPCGCGQTHTPTPSPHTHIPTPTPTPITTHPHPHPHPHPREGYLSPHYPHTMLTTTAEGYMMSFTGNSLSSYHMKQSFLRIHKPQKASLLPLPLPPSPSLFPQPPHSSSCLPAYLPASTPTAFSLGLLVQCYPTLLAVPVQFTTQLP